MKTLKPAPRLAADGMVPVAIPIVRAVKALHDGTASAHQQQIALQWIVREAAGKAYFPRHQSNDDTQFALGRLFVAEQIIGLFNAELSSLRAQDVPPPPLAAKS